MHLRVRRVFLALFIAGGLLAGFAWFDRGESGAEANSDSLVLYHKLDAFAGGAGETILFSDNFDDNSIDEVNWNTLTSVGATVTETGQQLELYVPSDNLSYATLMMDGAEDMTGKYVGVEIKSVSNASDNNDSQLFISDTNDGSGDHVTSDKVGFAIYSGSISAYSAGEGWNTLWTAGWDLETYKFWRIREDGGITYWDTSADGVIWTNRASETSIIDMSNVYIGLSGQVNNGSAPSATTRVFDNFYIGTEVGNTVVDSGGGGHNGEVTGAVLGGIAPTTSYSNDNSLDFDGIDDVVTVANAAELSPSAITVSAWVKLDGLSGGIQTIAAKWDVGSQQQYVLQVQDDDVYFYVGDGGSGSTDSVMAASPIGDTNWHHLTGSYDGTNISVYIDGIETTDTTAVTLGTSNEALTIGAKELAGTMSEYLAGGIDDVRVYSRALTDSEVVDLAAGDHTSATWDGSVSNDYEVDGNWDINSVPDPYTLVIIDTPNPAEATADIALAGLTINSGARLNLAGWDLAFNDGGVFSNNGTLQLKNIESLTGFTNDTNSGTILYTPDGYNTGLVAGNNYNNLQFNTATLAHWPLDNSVSEVSGFDNDLTANGGATYDVSVPTVHFADSHAGEFDGVDDYYSFDQIALPSTAASWCAWINPGSGEGTVLGSATTQALSISGGNLISVDNGIDAAVSWSVPSLIGAWHHVCITAEDITGSSLLLYVDGAQVDTARLLASGLGSVNRIGEGFDGLIDDVRIYSRTLDSFEVADLGSGGTNITIMVQTLTGNLDVNGDLIFSNGKIDVNDTGNYSINLGGDLLVYGGDIDPQVGEVVLDGTGQLISGTLTFYDLTKTVAAADTLTFGQGSTTTVLGTMTLQGASGQLLSLRSSTPGNQWLVYPSGTRTINYLDVQDSGNISGTVIDLTGLNVTDSGNNTAWEVNVGPGEPTALGPAGYVSDGYDDDTTPALDFTLSDANSGDQLAFQIQIDNNSDFSSPEVDYTSGLAAQGARSFTVGQAAGSGSYSVGAESQILTEGAYYWQVKAIDNYSTPHESAFSVANAGEVAFNIDLSAPSDPGTPSSASVATDKTPDWTWTASTDPAGLATPAYTVEWSDDNFSTAADGSDTTNTNSYTNGADLADGTWYFRVKAADTVGNQTGWITSSGHVIDTTVPTTPGAPTATSPTNDTTPQWTWTASTDSGSGLATTPYTVEWSDDNFSTVESSATSTTASFTHTDPLAEGTWYFRVKAEDQAGNETNWSSTGSVLIDTTDPGIPGVPSTTNPTNDTTPQWTWTASTDGGSGLDDPAYTVEWSNDNFSTTEDSATTNLNTFTHTSLLAEGTWYFRVKAADNAGNESAWTSVGTVLIDATAPSIPGTPTTTSPTNDTTPQWTWSASTDGGSGLSAMPYTVEWSNNNFSSVESSDTVSGTTFTHVDALAEGTWYFRVRTTDGAGNTSVNSSVGTVVVDTSAPSAPGSPSTSTPTIDNTPGWTWSASTDSGSGLATTPYTVEWSDDNFSTVEASSTTSSTTFTHVTGLADGTWYFRVKAGDVVGNESVWSSVGAVVIDTTAPSAPGTPTTTSPTNDTTPQWTWTASTDGGSGLEDPAYQVQWSEDNTFGSSTGDTINGSTFTNPSGLSEGTWYFRVRATDNAGNNSDWSANGSVLIDTTAPSIPGTPVTTDPTADTTPTWTWTASTDGGSGLAVTPYTVEWSDDDFAGGVDGASTATGNSFTHSTELVAGTWSFRVRTTDAAGNVSSNSVTGNVVIDLSGPSAPGAPSTTTPTSDTTPIWTWSASTDGSGLSGTPYTLEWSADSDFDPLADTGTSATTDFTHADALTEGTWYFRVKATDSVGNESNWSATGSVLIDTTAPSIPGTPTTTSPTSDTTPEWTWSASTDGGSGLTDPAYTIEWSDDNFTTISGSTTNSSTTYTHGVALADGSWSFRARATDLAGNTSTDSDLGTVVIDTTAPSTPGAPSTTSPTTDDTPTWTWVASTDGGVGLANPAYTVEWSEDNTFSTGVSTDTTNANNYTHTTPLPDGTWYFRIKAEDAVGNESAYSSSGSVISDNTAPSVPGAPSTSTPTSDTTPTWAWSISTDNLVGLRNPAYDIEWSQDNIFSAGVSSASSNSGGFTHSTTLAEGTWYIRVRAVDDLGNASGWSGNGTVLIATGGPTIPGQPTTSTPTTDTTPTWNWDASTATAGLNDPPYYLEWSEDNTFSAGVTSDTSTSNNFTHVTPLVDGVWYVRVRTQDNTLLYSGYSDLGSVLVDTTAPSVPGTPTTTSPTNDNTPEWSWSASTDSGSGLATTPYTVEWSDDNFSSVEGSDTVSGTTFAQPSGLTDGTWYFRVHTSDAVGNASANSATGTVIIDTTAPTTPGAPSTTSPTADTTPQWTWSAASDPGGTGLANPAYTVEWSDDNFASAADGSDTTNNTNYTHASALATGTWYFRVRATDAVGNSGNWSSVATVAVDTAAPTTPGTPSTTNPTSDTTPTWTWAASTDSLSGLAATPYTVEWSDDNFATVEDTATASGATFTHTDILATGTWYFRVRATDAVGNQSGWSAYGEVLVDSDAPSPPAAPTTDTPTNDNTPSWAWAEPADTGSGIDEYEVEWSDDNFTGVDGSDTTTNLTYTHGTGLADGTWYFRVRAIDNVGNASANSDVGTVLVDTTGPAAPGTPSSASPSSDARPDWTWSAPADSDVDHYNIQISQDNTFTTGVTNDTVSTTTYGDGDYASNLGDAVWYFRAQAVDEVGNLGAWSGYGQITVDTQIPVISNLSVTTYVDGAVIEWDTSEDASSHVDYGEPGNLSKDAEGNVNPNESSQHSIELDLPACSTFEFSVMSTDKFGNDSDPTTVDSFTTKGCSGNAAIMQQTNQTIGAAGGTVSLVAGSANLSLNIASGAVPNNTNFQIKQVSPAPALQPTGVPSGQTLVGSHVYDLKALYDSVYVTSFTSNITVTITHAASEVAGFTASSLAVYHWTGSAWQKLDSCAVDSSTRTVSCVTTSFSEFGLFGVKPAPAAEPDEPDGETTEPGSSADPLPEGDGTTSPEHRPSTQNPKDDGRVGDTSKDENGLAAAFTSLKGVLSKRPVWWISLGLLVVATITLAILRRRHGEKHVPYGIHKDKE